MSIDLPQAAKERGIEYFLISFVDLFGVMLVANYRICSEDTVFVNRVLERDAAPGSAMFWLLTRYLGFAAANDILMEGKSLTAQEALDLRLMLVCLQQHQNHNFDEIKMDLLLKPVMHGVFR